MVRSGTGGQCNRVPEQFDCPAMRIGAAVDHAQRIEGLGGARMQRQRCIGDLHRFGQALQQHQRPCKLRMVSGLRRSQCDCAPQVLLGRQRLAKLHQRHAAGKLREDVVRLGIQARRG